MVRIVAVSDLGGLDIADRDLDGHVFDKDESMGWENPPLVGSHSDADDPEDLPDVPAKRCDLGPRMEERFLW